jgi:hypothetical protein
MGSLSLSLSLLQQRPVNQLPMSSGNHDDEREVQKDDHAQDESSHDGRGAPGFATGTATKPPSVVQV